MGQFERISALGPSRTDSEEGRQPSPYEMTLVSEVGLHLQCFFEVVT